MSSLHGILPAVVTPFDRSGHFSAHAFERLIARLYSAGVHGLYVCGQTGEGVQQPLEQRKRVAEVALNCSPKGAAVIVHVGAPSTAAAVELARHAAQAGAHAISSLPPFGSYSFAEVREYYRALAVASEVPLLIYYFPAYAPCITSVDQVLELCAIPNVSGLKFTDTDLFRLWQIKQHGHLAFNGSDEMLVAGLLMGADGGIGSIYNVIPGPFVELYAHVRAGAWREARAIQDEINEFIAVVLRYPVHPAVKTLLSWLGDDCGHCLPPRRPLTESESSALHKAIGKTRLGESRFLARSEA